MTETAAAWSVRPRGARPPRHSHQTKQTHHYYYLLHLPRRPTVLVEVAVVMVRAVGVTMVLARACVTVVAVV